MTDGATLPWAMVIAGGAGVGFLFGLAYFASTRRTIELFLEGATLWSTLPSTLLRFGMAVVVFLVLAQWDAAAAVGGLIGLTVARQWAVARGRHG